MARKPRAKVGKWTPGRPSIGMTLWLLLIWVAVFASISPKIILSGVLVAAVVQLLFPMPKQKDLWHFRPIWAFYLLLHFMFDLARAGLQVARVVVTDRTHDDGIVRCDLRTGNQVYITIVAAMTSMIPGTIVVEASQQDKAIWLHCLDLEAQGGVQGIRDATWNQEKRVLLAFAPNKVLRKVGLPVPGTFGFRGIGRKESLADVVLEEARGEK